MNTSRSETSTKNLVSSKIDFQGHILRVTSAMDALESNLDLLIGREYTHKRGVTTSDRFPATLMESLMSSAPAFPKDTTLPFPLSKYSTHLLFRLSCKFISRCVFWVT